MQTFMMAYLILLFLPFVFSTRARILGAGYETVISNEPYKESRKVLTTMGEECTFPFRQGGRIHHHCLTILSSKPWCSLTHNFDRDRRWGFCAPEKTQPNVFVQTSRRIPDPCRPNPCQHGGVCTLIPQRHSFECSCPESFTGRLCEQTCRSNPCQNDGTCRLITSTDKEVCNCRHGYSGPYCSLEPETECYNSRGTDYRGLVGTTVSGARCLAWNSDLLYDELHVGTVVASSLRGLGEHAYCRNPDEDKMPWCYTLNDATISWEYCDVPSCVMAVSSSRRIVPFNALPSIKKAQPSMPPKKPVCGKKNKKRLPISRARILGGISALPGNHPWMAAIYIGQSDFCAGTMVSSCWIVSAAHCFFRNPLKSQLRVVLGQQKFNVTDHNTRTFGVEKYIFPKQFSVFNPTLHDIVLIKLAKQDGKCVKRTPFIRPICLPDKSMTFPDGYCCTISGWGHMYEKAQGYSSLQEAGVRLIPHDTCRKPNVYGNHVTADMVCAGLNGCVDACQGDSGGPLACSRNDVSFLYGIISWGEGCGRSQKPGVYTKVGNYIDWINSVIGHKPKAS
ncbi:hepatocyte growth factor activator isoform X2 [Perca fluviatilis]|uniref:hepatocyte growth factor activator isoform X2 n=1 Tax=Perca fluviatilis TaxID=8168 RepID=UPI001965F8BE|nr:hepatocyte growth factor activator isoform X2 [Perca fluviatilis]